MPIALYGDGTSYRDYTYVADIVDGIVRSIERIRGYEIINLGNSTPVPLVDLIALIEGEAGRKAVIEWREMQLGDVRSTYADIRRAKDLLGFVPAIKIQDGVRAFVEWFKKSRNL
jgi:UDP-glucuronate 4-epimerase